MTIIDLLKDPKQNAVVSGVRTRLYSVDGTWFVIDKKRKRLLPFLYSGDIETDAVETFIKNEER